MIARKSRDNSGGGHMEKIPAAIVGLGRIASLLEDDARREKPCTHAGAIAANPDCVLVGGCDPSEKRRKLFSERWAVPVFSDAAEMIRAQSPKILVIATHPDSHYNYCRLAADLGVPVVITEKPLADTLSSAKKIAALMSSGRTTIITNHERRYSADYIKAKEILACGKLGTILSVRAVLYMGNGSQRRLIDILWHDGTHLADAIMFLSDAILKHRKHWGAKLTSTTGTSWLEGELLPDRQISSVANTRLCARKIPVIIEVGAGRDHLVFEIEFSCEKGKLRIGNGIFEVWESGDCPYAEKFRSLKLSGEITSRSFEGKTGYFANMIADAVVFARLAGVAKQVDGAMEHGRLPVSSARDGLAVISYLHSVRAWRRRF
jgi:predicted dehydrogenase